MFLQGGRHDLGGRKPGQGQKNHEFHPDQRRHQQNGREAKKVEHEHDRARARHEQQPRPAGQWLFARRIVCECAHDRHVVRGWSSCFPILARGIEMDLRFFRRSVEHGLRENIG